MEAGRSGGRQSLDTVENNRREEHLQLQVLQIRRQIPFSDANWHQMAEPWLVLPPIPLRHRGDMEEEDERQPRLDLVQQQAYLPSSRQICPSSPSSTMDSS